MKKNPYFGHVEIARKLWNSPCTVCAMSKEEIPLPFCVIIPWGTFGERLKFGGTRYFAVRTSAHLSLLLAKRKPALVFCLTLQTLAFPRSLVGRAWEKKAPKEPK